MLQDLTGKGAVQNHRCQRISPFGPAGLVVLGDVQTRRTQERPDSPDHAGYVPVPKHEEGPGWGHVHIVPVQPHQSGMVLAEEGSVQRDRAAGGGDLHLHALSG